MPQTKVPTYVVLSVLFQRTLSIVVSVHTDAVLGSCLSKKIGFFLVIASKASRSNKVFNLKRMSNGSFEAAAAVASGTWTVNPAENWTKNMQKDISSQPWGTETWQEQRQREGECQ